MVQGTEYCGKLEAYDYLLYLNINYKEFIAISFKNIMMLKIAIRYFHFYT